MLLKITRKYLFLFFLIFISFSVSGFDRDVIPTDPLVEKGVFHNGLTYYIRENKKPENRIFLRLVVKTGSVMEDDDQQGLAHFLEHMAFNGTENFPGNSLVDFLEKEGVRFGPDLNAFTGFDKTVFMLELPADKPETVDLGMKVLADWAGGILNSPEEIEKERGVVIEEWRKDKGAAERISDAQLKTIFRNSRYAERIPIGKVEILESFEKETLDRYYRDWYRPDLMAVIAVGDFDAPAMKELITRYFNKFPLQTFRRKRIEYTLPDNAGTDYLVVKDKEASNANIRIIYKHDKFGEATSDDYREGILRGLFSIMLNNRYDEMKQKKDPPFLDASAGFGSVSMTRSAFSLSCTPDEKQISRGFERLMEEAARVKQNGFTETEFERAVQSYFRAMENGYRERKNTYSSSYVSEYTRNFTEGEYIPGIEYEYKLFLKLTEEITVDEVNELSDKYMTEDNRIVLLSAPEKESVNVPDEKELEAVLNNVFSKTYDQYIDEVNEGPLVDEAAIPEPGSVVSEDYDSEFNIRTYILSNGAKIVVKQTDFRDNEVLLSAVSRGGHSKVSDDDWASANLAAQVITRGGLGDFSRIELDKMLEGKIVSVTPFIEELTEGFTGRSSVEDLENMFRLLYLYFTSPSKDRESFDSYISRLKIYLANQEVQPDVVFSRTLRRILTDNHFRGKPFDLDFIKNVDFDRAYRIFRERFGDPGDFTFIFTGSVPPEEIRDLALKYISPLLNSPDYISGQREGWNDTGMRLPSGVKQENVYKGMDEKSEVALIFKGEIAWDRYENLILMTLADAADMRLREVIREEESGTYSINVYPSIKRYPVPEYQIIVYFGCSPDKAEELKKMVFSELEKLKKEIPDETLMKIKKADYQQQEKNLKENSFWESAILEKEISSSSLEWINKFGDMVDKMSTDELKKAASVYFNKESYIDVTLYPEKYEERKQVP